jgi:diguanylate cyclase (GGDEF)-like protein
MILPETNAAQAMQIAESARLAIAGLKLPHPASPVASFLTISAGVATASLDGLSTPEKLVAAADQALYRAKRSGRNRVFAAELEDVEQTAADAVDYDPS